MGKSLCLALLASGSLMLAGVAVGFTQHVQPLRGPIVAKNDFYSDSDGNYILIDGLCSVSTKAIDCWSPTGKADAFLTKQVKAEIFGPPVTFYGHYLKRTIFIVTESGSPSQSSLTLQCSFSPRDGDGSSGSMGGGSTFSDISVRNQVFYEYFPPKGQKRVNFNCFFTTRFGGDGMLSPTVGSETTIRGITFKIQRRVESREQARTGQYSGSRDPEKPQKIWVYRCEEVSGQEQPDISIFVFPQDRFLNSIWRVDKSGKPIEALPNGGNWRMTQSPVFFVSSKGKPLALNWTSAVDPLYVSSFDVVGSFDTEVKFPNLPLYPHK